MRIIITGGGTGGHLYPLIAVTRKLRQILGEECEILYIGSGQAIEAEAMQRENIPYHMIFCGKHRRYFSWQNFLDPFKTLAGFFQSLWILLKYMPEVVFAKGGYVSVPVVLAAWLYRIPVIIHESDAVAGSSNKLLSFFVKRIATAYPSAESFFPKKKTAFMGNPVREEITQGEGESLRKQLNFTQSKPVILVLGGSQGARIINHALVRILPQLLHRSQIIHQTGSANYEETMKMAAAAGVKAGHEGYFPVGFMDVSVLKDALSLADLIISRAGANSIAEIAAHKKPAILIPLENSANDHQRMNAYSLARIGGALVLEENNLGEHIFLDAILKILKDEELRKNLGEKISYFYHPEAAERIARGIIELGR